MRRLRFLVWLENMAFHTDKYKKVVWQCNHKFNGKKCSTPHFSEEEIKDMFVKAVNLLIADKTEIIATYEVVKEKLFSTKALDEERRDLENELNVTAKLVEDCIRENARIAQDQREYEERYQRLVERYEKAKNRYDEVREQINDRRVRGDQVSVFLRKLNDLDLIAKFDDDLWLSMVDFIEVKAKEDITFRFKDGSEVRINN